MRICVILPRFCYPATRGDTLRSWPQVDYLSRRHEVWLATLADPPISTTAQRFVADRVARLAVVPRSRIGSLVRGGLSVIRGQSLTAGWFASPRLRTVLEQWAGETEFDAVLTFSSAMAGYSDLVPARRKVLDLCDVDSYKWATYARRSQMPLASLFARESVAVARLEQRAVRGTDISLVVNQREQRKLATRNPGARTEILPTVLPLGSAPGRPQAVSAEPILAMVGSMFYPPNVRAVEWFGRYVWPLVRRGHPEAEWWIIGSRPTNRVRKWARHAGVRVTGFVPDLEPLLARIRVFLCPVTGDLGVQSKLIHALAHGLPAVVTPDAAAGLEYKGQPFRIAADPTSFAQHVGELVRDDQAARAVGEAGWGLVHERYTADTQFVALERWLGASSSGDIKQRAGSTASQVFDSPGGEFSAGVSVDSQSQHRLCRQ